MFACALYPTNQNYLESVRAEVSHQVFYPCVKALFHTICFSLTDCISLLSRNGCLEMFVSVPQNVTLLHLLELLWLLAGVVSQAGCADFIFHTWLSRGRCYIHAWDRCQHIRFPFWRCILQNFEPSAKLRE